MAFVLAPLTAAMSGGPAASVEQKGPPVKRVASHYGGAPVGLAPRQGTDISFRARRGDRVTLQVRSAEYKGSPCFGSQTLVDGRGSRTMRVAGYRGSRIFRVRTTGVAVLRFRGVCSSNKGQEPHPVRVQLTKLRLHTVAVDGAVTRVRAARRGFIDVAQLRVSRESRDKLVLRDRDGASAASAQMLVGPWLTPAGDRRGTYGVSVEAGHRLALSPSTWRTGSRLQRGQVIGLVATTAGYAEALRAREHRVALDDPAVTMRGERGREHIISYVATAEDRPYEVPVGTGDSPDAWRGWSTYSGGSDPDDPSVRRTIVFRGDDEEAAESFSLRIRRTVRGPDLVVGGPPVRFESADPGTHVVVGIPSSSAESVRLTASDVSVSTTALARASWGTDVPPTVCYRDCLYPGLNVSTDQLVADGWLFGEKEHELTFSFGTYTTGSVTLALTDRP